MRDAVEAVIEWQTGRRPRTPWRVARRCPFGHPSVIVSPSLLDDGTRFPTWAWLTCPHLSQAASGAESSGELGAWNARIASEPVLAARLARAEKALVVKRAQEGGGSDACAGDGIAGQRVPGNVKCLHAHVALFLAGVADPIGEEIVAKATETCGRDRCSRAFEQGVHP